MTFSIKKSIIFGVIVINLLGVWAFYHMFYGRKKSFDYSKKASIVSSKITTIETDQGIWKLNDSIFDFYHDYKVKFTNQNDIESFCKIIENSKSKYIDDRTSYWVDIYLNKIDLEPEIKLQKTISNEMFFKYDNHTYEGRELANFIEKNKVRQK